MALACHSELPPSLVKVIRETKRYAEGTPVRIEVRHAEDLSLVKILAKIKVEN